MTLKLMENQEREELRNRVHESNDHKSEVHFRQR